MFTSYFQQQNQRSNIDFTIFMDVAFEQQLEKDKIRKIRHENIPKLFTKRRNQFIKNFLVEQKLASLCDIHQSLKYLQEIYPPKNVISL